MEFLKVKRRRKSSIVLCMAIWHCMHFHNYSFNISHKLARNLLTIIAFIMLQTLGNFSPYSRTFSFLISESFFSILTPELIQPKCTTFICIWGKKMYFLTECPSCSHDANLRMHVWSSNGKNATFTGHVDLNLVGGGQKTRPV